MYYYMCCYALLCVRGSIYVLSTKQRTIQIFIVKKLSDVSIWNLPNVFIHVLMYYYFIPANVKLEKLRHLIVSLQKKIKGGRISLCQKFPLILLSSLTGERCGYLLLASYSNLSTFKFHLVLFLFSQKFHLVGYSH